jgi:hypothetical protein
LEVSNKSIHQLKPHLQISNTSTRDNTKEKEGGDDTFGVSKGSFANLK